MRTQWFWRDGGLPLAAFGVAALLFTACDGSYYNDVCLDPNVDCGYGEWCVDRRCEPIPGCFVDEDCGPNALCDTRGCPTGPICYLDYCELPPACLGQCVRIGGDSVDVCRDLDQRSCMNNDKCRPIYSTDGCSDGQVEPGGASSRCNAPAYDHCESTEPPPGGGDDGGPGTGTDGGTGGGDGGGTGTDGGTGDGGTTNPCPDGQILFNGQCQPRPGTEPDCTALDLTNCLGTSVCEVVADGGGAYRCSPATGRSCEGLDGLECESREDCGVVAGPDGNFGSCVTPTVANPCESPVLTGGACVGDNDAACPLDLCGDQCADQDEAGCLGASGLCRTYYSGSSCTCETNESCMCEELAFQSCATR